MPSPIGHVLGGAIAGLAVEPAAVFVCALAGAAPDVDILWGRHNAETHSVSAAVLAGLAVLAWTRGRRPRLALAVALAWGSHVLFDWLGSDDVPPIGVMALWPFSSAYYFANAYVFDTIFRQVWRSGFWSHNAWAVVKELLILGPIAWLFWWVAGRRRRT
jgi:membrane-bound metal-dependent hydrolase YbcI (DUF457 family)